MDEILFRSSQRIENLQYQLGLAANEIKQIINIYSTQLKQFISQILHSAKVEQFKESAQKLWDALNELATELKTKIVVYVNPFTIYEFFQKTFGSKWTRRDICFGCAGFIIGGIVGYSLSLAHYKKEQIVRYMQAIQVSNYAGIESVNVVEDAISPYDCGKDEVLINVKAASVNVIDAKICEGYGKRIRRLLSKYYQYSKHDLPVTLGRDCSGIVTEIGQNVSRFEIGDEVWLTSPFWSPGTLCQSVLVPQNRVAKKPKNIGYESSASLPYAGGIAWGILEKANLNETNSCQRRVLIHGGCTSVGCILVQILRAWKADVICTCFKRAVPVAKALGAEDIIVLPESNMNKNKNQTLNHSTSDLSILVKELELRDTFDTIILTQECDLNPQDLQKYCSTNGAILSTLPNKISSDNYGFFMGTIFDLYIKVKCVLQRSFGKELNSFGEPHICFGTLDELSTLVERGKLQTVVDKVCHPHDIENALYHIQSTESIGSTVITFR